MLHGIGQSALVVFEICKANGDCMEGGEFYLLGDERELPWSYDRLFKYEITQQLAEFDLKPEDRYDIHYVVYDLQSNSLGEDLFGDATVIYSPGSGEWVLMGTVCVCGGGGGGRHRDLQPGCW